MTLHVSGITVVAESHGRCNNEGDAALGVEELLGGSAHVVTVQGLHRAGRELVGALGEDVVERLAAAPDLEADVPAGGHHDADGLRGRLGRHVLRSAGLEERAHHIRVPVYGPPAELAHLGRPGDGADQRRVVLDDALPVPVVSLSAVCGAKRGLSTYRGAGGGLVRPRQTIRGGREDRCHTCDRSQLTLQGTKMVVHGVRESDEDGRGEELLEEVVDACALE
jgi:hypothetical protein